MKALVAVLLASPVFLSLACTQPTNPPLLPEYATLGETSAGALHGVNLGNFLEAPVEGEWSGGRPLQESDFSNIRQAGFG